MIQDFLRTIKLALKTRMPGYRTRNRTDTKKEN